jgi:hypothetical protein
VETRKKKKEEKAEASSSPTTVVISEPVVAGEAAPLVPVANPVLLFGEGSPRAKCRRVSSVSQDQLSLF